MNYKMGTVMHYIKTSAGQRAFNERHADLGQRLRSAFLLFDGQRSFNQVLATTAGLGVLPEDIEFLIAKDWLQERGAVEAELPSGLQAPALAPAKLTSLASAASAKSAMASDRYHQA